MNDRIFSSTILAFAVIALAGCNFTQGRDAVDQAWRLDTEDARAAALERRIDRTQLALQDRLTRLDEETAGLRADAGALGDHGDPGLDATINRLEVRIFAAHENLYDLDSANDETIDEIEARQNNNVSDIEAEYARARVALESLLERAGR